MVVIHTVIKPWIKKMHVATMMTMFHTKTIMVVYVEMKFLSNLKSCDCFTSIIASVSKSVCSKATEDSDWGYYDDSTLSIMDFFTADNTPASNTGMTTQTDGAINDNQNTGSKTSSGAANYLTSFSIGTFFVFVLGLI